MKDFEQAKKDYEAIPIPEELGDRVQAGIRQGQAMHKRAARRPLWRTVGACAACLVVALGALNLSPTVAAAAADVPVLGGLFRVLTLRSFTDESGDRTVAVEQPAIEGGGALAERVNGEIQKRVDEKIAQGERLVEEYRDAFFATGGTQAEWEQHENTVRVSYDIKSQTDTTLSFVVSSDVSIASAYQDQAFYNLDLEKGRELTLEDVLGGDWKSVCNDSIRAQMAAAQDPTVYFGAEMGGFTTVDETTSFYIDQEGDPVVVFPRATVAVGALGAVEFTITR